MPALLAHIAFLLFLVGIILSTHKTQVTNRVYPGYQIRLGEKTALLRSIDQSIGPTYRSLCGNIILHDSAASEFALFPEKRFYFCQTTVNTQVAIHTNWLSDTYWLIGTGSNEGGWFLTVMELPFQASIWFGFCLATLAGINALMRQLKIDRIRWI